jgi:hypothetical protein
MFRLMVVSLMKSWPPGAYVRDAFQAELRDHAVLDRDHAGLCSSNADEAGSTAGTEALELKASDDNLAGHPRGGGDATGSGDQIDPSVALQLSVIALVMAMAPNPPGSRQSISRDATVFEIAPAKVLPGAVRLQGGAPHIYTRCANCAANQAEAVNPRGKLNPPK